MINKDKQEYKQLPQYDNTMAEYINIEQRQKDITNKGLNSKSYKYKKINEKNTMTR